MVSRGEPPTVFEPVDIPTRSGRQTVRRWRARCVLCQWSTEPTTGQDAAVAIIQHNRTAHNEGWDAMPPAG
jgi:hypothetical protein